MTRQERAAQARARLQRARLKKRAADYRTRDVGPLPMSERFWRDIDVLHIRCQKIIAYAPRPKRDMERGVR